MLTRNTSRIINKINAVSPTSQTTVSAIRDMLPATILTKMYELAESTVSRLRKDTSKRWFIVEVTTPKNEVRERLDRYNIQYPVTRDVPQPSRLLVSIVSLPKRYQISEIEDILCGEHAEVYLNPEMVVLEYS